METTMPTTYTEAHNVSAYTLARRWADMPWPLGSDVGRTPQHDLEELATMTALADWLQRWTPLTIHGAAMRGATIDEIAAATGMDTVAVRESWRKWADGQRHLSDARPDFGVSLSVEDYNQAAAVLGCPSWPTA